MHTRRDRSVLASRTATSSSILALALAACGPLPDGTNASDDPAAIDPLHARAEPAARAALESTPTETREAIEPDSIADCSEASIRAAAPASATVFLDRAYDWIHRAVPYCQCVSGAGGPYRTDCSGFVSYAWGLPAPGNTTYSLAGGPWDNHASVRITMDALTPGDALNFPGDPSAGTGHVVMFGGWLDGAHTRFCSLEESHHGEPAHVIVRNVDPAFLPIRLAGYTPSGEPTTTPAPSVPPADLVVALEPSPDGQGYLLVAGDGGVYAMGDAAFHGSTGGVHLNGSIVGIARTPTGGGYWLVGSDGGVFAFGDAGYHGSLGGTRLNAAIVGIAATPTGGGYWLVGGDGGVFAFGDAGFHGSMGGMALDAPVVGMAATPSGNGYWLVGGDGGVFAFGDAGYHGSMGGVHLNAAVVGIAATPSGGGYWLVGGDGGVFTFGDAGFHGSMAGTRLNAPITGIARTPTGDGYWLVAHDGGVFTFGDAHFAGAQPQPH